MPTKWLIFVVYAKFFLSFVVLVGAAKNLAPSGNTMAKFHRLQRPIVSALIGCAVMQSTPASAQGLTSLGNIVRASESIDYMLENIDSKDTDISKLFDEVDFIIKRYNLRERLQLAIAETPTQYRACAEPKAASVMSDLYTLVEYYSVSNDSINRRMMIADSVPGEKLKFLRVGLSSVRQDLRGLFFCYPSELKQFNN